MHDDSLYDITIIGAGPVGLFGVFYAGMRDAKTKLIDALPQVGGQLSALYPEKYIYDVPGFPKVLAKELVANLHSQAMWKNATPCLGERVLERLPGEDAIELVTEKGRHISRTVIIAAGIGALTPKKLNKPGVHELEGKGIYYTVSDRSLFDEKDLVIVGGGDSALDWCLDLQHVAHKVTLVHRRDVFRAHEDSIEQLMESDIEKLLFWEVEEAHGVNHLEALTLVNKQAKETKRIPADVLLLNIGFGTDLGPIKDWGLDLEGGSIVVNQQMESNIPGVYAAGDIATYPGKLKLIVTGYSDITVAVNYAKNYIEPESKIFPGHSSHKIG